MSKLIIEEPPLQVLPSLAITVGLVEAIILQQLHYLLRDPRFGKQIAGEKWIFNTAEDWRWQYFPFWTEKVIRKAFKKLASMKVIEMCQPEGRTSRRKYYRIDTDELERLSDVAQRASSMLPKKEDGKWTKRELPLCTKTSIKEDENRDADGETTGKSRNGFSQKVNLLNSRPLSKKLKLAAIPTPAGHPTEEAFDDFLNHQQLESVIRMRPDLFHSLCENKWHCWSTKLQKWTPVVDWQKYVLGLEEHLHAVTHRR